ncbi:MAG: DUF465 domain-containing protein [Bradymonadaceae bacterium]
MSEFDEPLVENADSTEEALDQLREKHQSLENRLDELETPRSLSPEEEYEMQEIKKQKLKIKDEIVSLEGD